MIYYCITLNMQDFRQISFIVLLTCPNAANNKNHNKYNKVLKCIKLCIIMQCFKIIVPQPWDFVTLSITLSYGFWDILILYFLLKPKMAAEVVKIEMLHVSLQITLFLTICEIFVPLYFSLKSKMTAKSCNI